MKAVRYDQFEGPLRLVDVPDPTPSHDDARLTIRLVQAADLLDMPLLDHLIVGDTGRYYSFREAGIVGQQKRDGDQS